jgi:hypothetical protein
MATVMDVQREVGARLGRGDSLSNVEADVIEPSGLSEEGKAAAWLFGWAYLERCGRPGAPAPPQPTEA